MRIRIAIALVLWSLAATWGQVPTSQPIDWNHARELHQRSQRGEQLSPQDRAYLERAIAQRQGRGSTRPTAAAPAPRPAPRESLGLVPLSDMTAAQEYKGQRGGLYGLNGGEMPEALRDAAMAQAAKIQPLDLAGNPAPSGKIVLLSIGMSNTTQ